MPRTKAQRTSNLKNKENINNVVVKQENPQQIRENLTAILLSTLDQEFKMKRLELKNKYHCALEAINNISFEEFTACVEASKAHKTISEMVRCI